MNFIEKKKHYTAMQGPQFLDADRALLEKMNPGSPALRTGVVDKARAQRETLFALLDVATPDEIKANRPAEKKVLSKQEMDAIVALAAKKSYQIHSVSTLDKKDVLVAEIKDMLKELPEAATTIVIKHAESIVPDFVKEKEDAEAKAYAEKQLIELDIEKADQKKLSAITRILKLQPENFKGDTLKALLLDYRNNLPKTENGNGEENTEIPVDLDKVNELEEENEDLRTELEDKEAENEDLQDQVNDLTDQLEEEKKSETDLQ